MPSAEHDRLTHMAARWLRRNGFGVVATELRCAGAREEPDAIGFRGGASAIVEIKVSRSDFHADKAKPERQAGGLGLYRFYLCPEGLIQPEELPERWGLVYAKGRRINVAVAPKGNLWPALIRTLPEALRDAPWAEDWQAFQHEPDASAEWSALYSIARRAQAEARQNSKAATTP